MGGADDGGGGVDMTTPGGVGGGGTCGSGSSCMINREVEKKPVAKSEIYDAGQLLTSSLMV